MSKIAIIYPGQGAQKVGMGADFYETYSAARAIFDEAHEALDIDLKDICFKENEKIHLTEYTQPALVATCLAMTAVLKEAGVKADLTAGLSLGEYAAIATAGAMDPITAIQLVRKRGRFMQQAAPAGEGAMCAILGLETDKILSVVDAYKRVSIANYNCPGQIVITGAKAEVMDASALLKEAGARRTLMLKVSGPFHSAFMEHAGEALKKEIDKISFRDLKIPYVANVTAKLVRNKEQIGELLSKGVSSSVKWQQSMEFMISQGVDTFVEIGPGKTLAGFMKKINPSGRVLNVSCVEDVEHVLEELKIRK